MTLVNIDLGDVAGGHYPDDHVIIRAENFRESPTGGITSTAEVVIPLVDGVGQAEVEPGPVVVTFRCRAVADTREKRGVVPESGPVGIEEVIAGAFEYTPPVVNRGLDLIEDARDEAVGQVGEAVDVAIATHLHTKADKQVVDELVLRVPAGGLPGQILRMTPDGGVWSWADQHTPDYHDTY